MGIRVIQYLPSRSIFSNHSLSLPFLKKILQQIRGHIYQVFYAHLQRCPIGPLDKREICLILMGIGKKGKVRQIR